MDLKAADLAENRLWHNIVVQSSTSADCPVDYWLTKGSLYYLLPRYRKPHCQRNLAVLRRNSGFTGMVFHFKRNKHLCSGLWGGYCSGCLPGLLRKAMDRCIHSNRGLCILEQK